MNHATTKDNDATPAAESDVYRTELEALVRELSAALRQIAELEGDDENQKFTLTRFQAAQVARLALTNARAVLERVEGKQ